MCKATTIIEKKKNPSSNKWWSPVLLLQKALQASQMFWIWRVIFQQTDHKLRILAQNISRSWLVFLPLSFVFSPCGRREEVKAVIPEVSEHLLTNSVLCQCASAPAFEMPSYASPIAANICCSSTFHTLLTLLFFSTLGLNHKQVHRAKFDTIFETQAGFLGKDWWGETRGSAAAPWLGEDDSIPSANICTCKFRIRFPQTLARMTFKLAFWKHSCC